MTVLVAGGGGFIGSALVRELIGQRERVAVLDDFSVGSRANLADLEGRIDVHECDAADERALGAALRRIAPDRVVSCIGDTYVPACYDNPERFFRINLTAHLNLLQACRAGHVRRLLYLSSAEVYGHQPEVALDERAALGAANTYAVSKLAADQLMQTFAIEHGVPTVIARVFNSFGPRETHAYIVPELISQLSRGSVLRIGNSGAVRDFTYVEDTARALALLLNAPAMPGTAVNIGSGSIVSVAELAGLIGRLIGHNEVTIETDDTRLRRNDITAIRCDNALLRSLTGWAPSVGIEEGLRRTIDWFRANGNRWPWHDHDADIGGSAAVELSRQSA